MTKYCINIDVLPNEVFNAQYNNPKTDGSGFIRNQLQEATKLIKDAGWIFENGNLVGTEIGALTKLQLDEFIRSKV